MNLTTHNQQLKECFNLVKAYDERCKSSQLVPLEPLRRPLKKEDRLALCRYVLNIICSCTFVGVLSMLPELDTAFSWIKG